MRFVHGTASGDPLCKNQPASFPHVRGYTSFWEDIWFAPGVGPIQGDIIWYEASCDGSAGKGNQLAWAYYLDTIT